MKRFKISTVLFSTAIAAALIVPWAIAAEGKGAAKYDRSKEMTIRGTVEDVSEQGPPGMMRSSEGAASTSQSQRSPSRTDQPSTTTPSTTTPSTSTTTPSTSSTSRTAGSERAGMMDETMRGTWVTLRVTEVSGVGSSSRSSTATGSIATGSTVPVFLAPSDFLSSHNFTVSKGDQLEVVGARVEHHGTECILARQVKKDGATLNLRNSSGKPEWEKGSSRSSRPER